ncbi:MAG TPA: phenylalanine--tRNA ligase subunit beta [Bacteroidales bacterium]|nr:phenylalanine--tRNA ligase subunit beta [Bacteroidales bacterium]
MKISYNWLKQYLDFNIPPNQLGEILTNIGLEVEGIEDWVSVEGGLEGVVIGEVKECRKHPHADKLSLTKVDIGSGELLSIVCGAPNVATGQKVPVATVGTTLIHKGEGLLIKRSKIRGELSEGMICAEDELGLGDDHEGIIVLPDDTEVGMKACDFFNIERDVVFEIGLTPNRIDSGSHFGVARDLAAYLSKKEPLSAVLPSVEQFNSDNNSYYIPVIVENQTDCPRYTGLTISNVTVTESPAWLRNRLRAIGLSPVNNIVDITNWVLHEAGQPLHAFDADQIEGKKVIVRNLPNKTRFQTLDEEIRELSSGDLMICNEKEGMCIAGVFGGMKSGVTATTKNIFLESAYFNPVSIRKTARRHGLSTDASFRFERGVDPEITSWALKRAAMLISEIAGGQISSDVIDVYPLKIKNHIVDVTITNIYRLIGKKIAVEEIKDILRSLEIKTLYGSDEQLKLEVPAYRVDVTREADVIEEILRIYGYNNVEIGNKINSTLTYIEKPDKEKVVNTISDMLSGYGFMEIMSNSLNPASWYLDSGDFDNDTLVMLANPLSSDLNAMRQSLLFGGLAAVCRNINRQNTNLRFYEFGNCYFRKKDAQPGRRVENHEEHVSLDFFVTGNQELERWNSKAQPVDFFFMKSTIGMVIEKMGTGKELVKTTTSEKEYFSEGISYLYNNHFLAESGRVSRKLLEKFEIKQEVYYGHIEWDLLFSMISSHKLLSSDLPKYPSVRRDLALLIDNNVNFSDIRDLAFRTEKEILREVDLFDVYESDSLGENKVSYAVSFILRDDRRTLNDKMIDKVMNNLIRVFKKELGAKIR